MYKLILGTILIGFILAVSGCQTVKNTTCNSAVGAGITVYGFGKGLSDDVYNTWKAVEKADNWFRENYW